MDIKERFPFLKSSEDVISMILGLLIVVVVAGLIINYFQKKSSGNISQVGVSDTVAPELSVTVEPTVKPTAVRVMVPTGQPIKGGEYVVAAGDSLWKIAGRRYGSGFSWVDIAKANKLKNTELAIGQKLILPDIQSKAAVVAKVANPIEGGEYTVAKGDSLSKIALRAYGDSFGWTKIYQANNKIIRNPSLIFAGTKLVIPR